MPFAVTHILIPIFIIAIIRDFLFKKKFSLHYVLIAGLAGVLPDIDIALYFILSNFGFTFDQIHKTILHSLAIPIFFLVLFAITNKIKMRLGRHKLKPCIIFLMISFGTFTHLILDALFGELIVPLWPFNNVSFGINILEYLPEIMQSLILPILDGLIFIFWLLYLELKHKISDFI